MSDIMLGKNCGMKTMLVGSGMDSYAAIQDLEKSPNAEDRKKTPDYYADNLKELLLTVKAL